MPNDYETEDVKKKAEKDAGKVRPERFYEDDPEGAFEIVKPKKKQDK